MAGVNKTPENVSDKICSEDCEDVEKILSVVVKRRKTIPSRCMEINKQISAIEIFRLENAKVVIEESEEKENFRKAIHGFRKLRAPQFTLQDLHEAEQKLQKYWKRINEINSYLERRKNLK